MDDISYVAGVGASVFFGAILWWAYGRFQPRLTKVLFSVDAFIVAMVVYFALGIAFMMARPERMHETGAALAHGLKTFAFMAIFVQAVVMSRRAKTKVVQGQPQGSVRERLVKTRGDIQRRIENLQTSPVFNYGSDISEPDMIIEELTERLKEIDAALATLGTK
jgi:branched-subunit amino acid ABC-type transport system permease component